MQMTICKRIKTISSPGNHSFKKHCKQRRTEEKPLKCCLLVNTQGDVSLLPHDKDITEPKVNLNERQYNG